MLSTLIQSPERWRYGCDPGIEPGVRAGYQRSTPSLSSTTSPDAPWAAPASGNACRVHPDCGVKRMQGDTRGQRASGPFSPTTGVERGYMVFGCACGPGPGGRSSRDRRRQGAAVAHRVSLHHQVIKAVLSCAESHDAVDRFRNNGQARKEYAQRNPTSSFTLRYAAVRRSAARRRAHGLGFVVAKSVGLGRATPSDCHPPAAACRPAT